MAALRKQSPIDAQAELERAWSCLPSRPFHRNTTTDGLRLMQPAGCDNDARVANQHDLQPWQAHALNQRIAALPSALSEAVSAALIDGTTDPANALGTCAVLDHHRRLFWFAGINIDANNKEIHAASLLMANRGRQHQHNTANWLEWLNVPAPSRHPERRVKDDLWWRKALRAAIRQTRERAWLVGAPTKVQWCSDDGIEERVTIDQTAQQWATRREFVSNTGARMAAPTPAQSDLRQSAEMLAISAGISKLAAADSAYLLTLTCPSRFHRTRKKKGAEGAREENPKWDGSTPREGFEYLQTQWTRFRAALHRAGLGKYWVMGVQPHEDQTPHAHVTFWFDRADEYQFQAIVERYFRHNEREAGDNHRVDLKRLGCATNGVKYVARAISYISRASEHDDDTPPEQKAESLATKQWASTWGIRRFRSSHTKRTVWRLARRQDVLPDGDELKTAARSNDYAAFIKQYEQRGGKMVKIDGKNRFDESVRRVVGLELDGVSYLKSTTWTKVRLGGSYSYSNMPSKSLTDQSDAQTWAEDMENRALTRQLRRLGAALGDPNTFLQPFESANDEDPWPIASPTPPPPLGGLPPRYPPQPVPAPVRARAYSEDDTRGWFG